MCSNTYPMKAKKNISTGSNGMSTLNEVLKRAVMVASDLNQTAASLNKNAPHTAPKNPRQ